MNAEPYRFDEFVIESMIGEGGMGKVYRARQTALDRWIALKVLPRALEDPRYTERFYREARAAAKLVHPNIVQIHTVGEHKGVPFFAMEYVEGEDLAHLLKAKTAPFSSDETIEILRCVVKALSVAATFGIVHRDIKPANIMISGAGLVKVMDFGLAKEVDAQSTNSGVYVGTPAYMSPEQGAGNAVDFRSDEYSLGCVLYEVISGRQPFEAPNAAALLYKHMYEEPPPLSSTGVRVVPELERVCVKMLAKKPEDRFQTPDELLLAVGAIPCNSTAAEMALAKRAQGALHMKNTRASRGHNTYASLESLPSPLLKSKAPEKRAPVSEAPPAAAAKSGEAPAAPARTGESPATPDKTGEAPAAPLPPAPPPAPAAVSVTRRAKFESGPRPATPTGSISATAHGQTGLPDQPPPPPGDAAPPPSAAPPARPPMPSGTMVLTPGTFQPAPPGSKTMRVVPKDVWSAARPSESKTVARVEAGGLGPTLERRSRTLFAVKGGAGFSGLQPVARAPHVDDYFQKAEDGRWTYTVADLACKFADGLAAQVPPVGPRERGLNDCYLCRNWSKKYGCVLAYAQELERINKFTGLHLAVDVANAWRGVGRRDKAIEVLEAHVKAAPEEPAGYHELARLFDHSDLPPRERRRGIVLYNRFAELARKNGGFSAMEIARAEERANALSQLPANTVVLTPPAQPEIDFDCFLQAGVSCFCHGRLNREKLVLARAGEIDPETGMQAQEMSRTMVFATTILKRFKSEESKKEQEEQARKELLRLRALSCEALQADASRVVVMGTHELSDVRRSLEHGRLCVALSAYRRPHQMFFSESNSFKGEQCYTLLRRLATK